MPCKAALSEPENINSSSEQALSEALELQLKPEKMKMQNSMAMLILICPMFILNKTT
jgi:hypothetical protein